MFCACSTLARLGPEVLECQALRSYTIAATVCSYAYAYARVLLL